MTAVNVQNQKSLLGVSTLVTTFTAITGSLKFTQAGGHVGDEFHPFPLKHSFLTEASGTVAGLHCDFEVFVLFCSVSFHSCVALKSLIIHNLDAILTALSFSM